jgi:hypothetical protein
MSRQSPAAPIQSRGQKPLGPEHVLLHMASLELPFTTVRQRSEVVRQSDDTKQRSYESRDEAGKQPASIATMQDPIANQA